MPESSEPCPVLMFAYGNPARGDDALGPALYERIQAQQRDSTSFSDVELLTDYQLQVEHALDLQRRRWVLFVDASLTAQPPYVFYPLQPARSTDYTTHAMSPAAVLAVYRQVYRQPPPPAFMLSIRGYDFRLGQPLSTRARHYLDAAFTFVRSLPFAQPFDQNGFCKKFCT